jgi:NADPH:quinone reductase-like Zn-dependent oxidoreductase
MNDTMQAISQDELGGPEVLASVSLPRPTPGIGEVLVRVHAASVNPVAGSSVNRRSSWDTTSRARWRPSGPA